MKLKDNSTQEIDTALYQLEQRLKSNIRLTDVENSNASSAKINAVDKKLTEEVKDRQSADGKLQNNINKEIADRQEADAAIENAKQDKLIAGNNIQIDGNIISATSTEYTAEAPVKVTDGKISLDTVPVNKGGTGVTTQADINKAFIGNLEVGSSDVTDGTEFVSSWASDNGFAETADGALNSPYKRQFVKVWNYIKGKISSVLGLTKDTYGGKANTAGTADSAITDANGNNIVNTYATKTDIEKTTTKGVSLSTVTTGTTKYIKLGTFHWYDSFSFRCRIAGNSFEDDVNINILGGISNASSVCGYYSTNSMLTKSIIVKRGDAWDSDFEIYLKITQLTTAEVYVTIDKGVQDKINISESTTAPSGTLEEIVFNNINGMFSGNIDAKNISGKVSTAGNADTAETANSARIADAILDYYRGTPIMVRWGGDGINSADWYPAFNADGSALEPINKANIRAGKSDRTTGIEYTGESEGCISAQQTPVSFNNSLAGEWASYIICNHGNGTTYYHQMLRLPFFSDTIQLQRREAGELKGWKNVAIIENENTWSGRQNFNTAKASSKMVIPIGAPSSLEDGCIWIER